MNTSRQSRARRVSSTCVLVAVLLSAPALADQAETIQRAAEMALNGVSDLLGRQALAGVKNIAVVPLRGDSDEYITELARGAVTRTQYALFTRSDETWDMLLKEIEWGARRDDVMNPETVQRFGKVEGVEAILDGIGWDKSVNLWSIRAHVKVTLKLADVETGQTQWHCGPLEGEAFMHWSDALVQFWRFPLLLLGALVILVILILFFAKLKRAYRQPYAGSQ